MKLPIFPIFMTLWMILSWHLIFSYTNIGEARNRVRAGMEYPTRAASPAKIIPGIPPQPNATQSAANQPKEQATPTLDNKIPCASHASKNDAGENPTDENRYSGLTSSKDETGTSQLPHCPQT